MLEYNREWTFNQTVSIPLAIYTGKLKKIDASFVDKQLIFLADPDSGEDVLFTDCSDLSFEVNLSNNKDFTVLNKSGKSFLSMSLKY